MAGSESLADRGVADLIRGYRSGEFCPHEALGAMIARIERWEPRVHALTATRCERALQEARAAARRYRAGTARPLEGVPFVVKDLLDSAALPTAYGAPSFAIRRPRRDAVCVARLRAAGAILLAKTATHQFGLGITTVPDHGRPATRNPRDPRLVAGGSSGGSAAALAYGAAPLALGTDSAGSIRIPADFCGVVGLRPTLGAIPRAGALALAPSLDQVGPMGRSPADVAAALAVLQPSRRHRRARGDVLAGLRVGVSDDLGTATATGERRRAVERVAALLEEGGASVQQLRLPESAHAYETLSAIVSAEVVDLHRRLGFWPDRRLDYDEDTRRRLERAERLTVAQRFDALCARERVRDELAAALATVDLLLSPVSGCGPIAVAPGGGGAEFRRRAMRCTAPQSLAGLPACAVPTGVDRHGRPLGVQLTGPAGSDLQLLLVAEAVHAEARTPPR